MFESAQVPPCIILKGFMENCEGLSGARGVSPGWQGGSSERRLLELYRASVLGSFFILLARICVHASSITFLARIRVCITALIEGIRHHSFGPCLQLGEPSERDGPLETLARWTPLSEKL